jgi:hypothetical protein
VVEGVLRWRCSAGGDLLLEQLHDRLVGLLKFLFELSQLLRVIGRTIASGRLLGYLVVSL